MGDNAKGPMTRQSLTASPGGVGSRTHETQVDSRHGPYPHSLKGAPLPDVDTTSGLYYNRLRADGTRVYYSTLPMTIAGPSSGIDDPGTITIDGTESVEIYCADTVTLAGDLTMHSVPQSIDGANLTVVAREISWPAALTIDTSGLAGPPPSLPTAWTAAAADGPIGPHAGWDGSPGTAGSPGSGGAGGALGGTGGAVLLAAQSFNASGQLKVVTTGGTGGAGQDGQSGQDGGNGGNGSTTFDWQHQGWGNGGNGGVGGVGGPGGNGGGGGTGGNVRVLSIADTEPQAFVIVDASGGAPGKGGAGGQGGHGGKGGIGGSFSGSRDHGDNGADAPAQAAAGANGQDGIPIYDEDDGEVTLLPSVPGTVLLEGSATDDFVAALLPGVPVLHLGLLRARTSYALSGGVSRYAAPTAASLADLTSMRDICHWLSALKGLAENAAGASPALNSIVRTGAQAESMLAQLASRADAYGHSDAYVPVTGFTDSYQLYASTVETYTSIYQAWQQSMATVTTEETQIDALKANGAVLAQQIPAGQTAAAQTWAQAKQSVPKIEAQGLAVRTARTALEADLSSAEAAIQDAAGGSCNLGSILSSAACLAFLPEEGAGEAAGKGAALLFAGFGIGAPAVGGLVSSDQQADVAADLVVGKVMNLAGGVTDPTGLIPVVTDVSQIPALMAAGGPDSNMVKVTASAEQLKQQLDKYKDIRQVAEAMTAIDSYLAQVGEYNDMVMAYTQSLALYVQQLANVNRLLAGLEGVQQNLADLQSPQLDAAAVFATGQVHAARDACLYQLDVVCRALSAKDLSWHAVTEVLTATTADELTPTAFQATLATGAPGQQQGLLGLNAQANRDTGEPPSLFPFTADQAVKVSVSDKTLMQTLISTGSCQVNIPVASSDATLKDSPWAHKTQIRVGQVGVALPGVKGEVVATITPSRSQKLVRRDGSMFAMSRDPLAGPYTFQSTWKPGQTLPVPVPFAPDLDEFPAPSPFTTWTVSLDQSVVEDLQNATSLDLYFSGGFYPPADTEEAR